METSPFPEKTKVYEVINLVKLVLMGIIVILLIPFIIAISQLQSGSTVSWVFMALVAIFLLLVIFLKTIEIRSNFKGWKIMLIAIYILGGLQIILGLAAAISAPYSPFYIIIFCLVFVIFCGILGVVIYQSVWMLCSARRKKVSSIASQPPPQSNPEIQWDLREQDQFQIYQPRVFGQKGMDPFQQDSHHPVFQVANDDYERQKMRYPSNMLPPNVDFHPAQEQQIEHEIQDPATVPKAIKIILGMYGFDSSEAADNKIIEHMLTTQNKIDLGDGEDAQCSICLCDLEAKEHIYILTVCKHYFHEQCLKQWMDSKQPNCPYCRKDVILPWKN